MLRSTLLRGVSAGAFALAFMSAASAPAQEALPTIDIAAGAGGGAPTSGLQGKAGENGYARAKAVSATKTNVPILDTPRSVQIIPHEVLEDNQVLNTQEAVKFVSGVQTSPAAYYDRYSIRGFATGNNTYRNSLKLFGVAGTEDVAFIDRVEVVKGPAAMLYGRIQPGGLVNFVTKKPQAEAAYSIQEQFGSWGLSRTTVDATGPLDQDKTLLYRVIGVFDRADDFVDFLHRDNGRVYGALSWKPTEQFESNLQVEYYHDSGTNTGYYRQLVPALALSYAVPGIAGRPANLPRNWSQSDSALYTNYPSVTERFLVYGDLTYRFNNAWKVSSKVHYSHSDEDQEYILSRGFNLATGVMSRRLSWSQATRDTWSLNLDVNGEFETGILKHNLLVGFDYYDYHYLSKGDFPQGAGPEISALNIFAPSYGGVAWQVLQAEHYIASGNISTRSKQQDFGYYIQDSISYNDFIYLLLGGRYDVAFDADSELYGVTNKFYYGTGEGACFPICDGHYNPSGKGNPTERKFSPNGGLLFKLTPEISAYASYSESFASSNAGALSYSGQVFKPQQGKQYELGLKASLFDGRLTGSIVGFDLHLTNQLSADPQHTGFSVQSGEVRSRGVEVDLAGQVTDNISVIGSYTYDDAIIVKDTTTGTGAVLGKRWPGVPRHAGNVWAKYDTAPGQKEGWSFGAGFYANGERQGNNTNSWQLPGYVRFDTMLGYRTVLQGIPVEAQLNVTNIADAKYFEAAGSGNYAYYGAPRTFTGSVKVKF
ncbi:TonB-dependent siderophore receptor [Methylosinus sp. RM1]|uniref:TonB-dependent siderophore receptor n=1 Tax=Methylosinus sp. RM1 TaxID=2583817 RepID=UPI00140E1AF9|nr:TonB-dependent siderophore receptor [Methylosinus sp. RM1]